MSETGRCETCRWWKPISIEDHDYLDSVVERTADTRWGQCFFVIDTNDHREDPHSSRAYPQDASGYRAWLQVRSDFGCIEHAARSVEGSNP